MRRNKASFLLVLGVIVIAAVLLFEWRRGFIRRRLVRYLSGPNATITERPLPNPKILIWKGKRQLLLYSGEDLTRMYRIGLGFAPEGDKIKKGDGCTPEGTFYVCSKNSKSRFYLALGLSYPNGEDAQRGLHDRLISARQHERIVNAIRSRRQPPWNTPLGGAILIHGHGSHRDWTLGCIALDNDDMRHLYERVPVGTTVTICR